MRSLLIVNDPPYGTERAYNALRLATALVERQGEDLGAGAWRRTLAELAEWTTWADRVLVF